MMSTNAELLIDIQALPEIIQASKNRETQMLED